jgi:hypothetical protein
MTSPGTDQSSQPQDAPPAWTQELFGRLYNDMQAQLRVLEQRIEERNRTNITTATAISKLTPFPSQATTIPLKNEIQTLEIARRKNQLPDFSEFHGKRSEFRA